MHFVIFLLTSRMRSLSSFIVVFLSQMRAMISSFFCHFSFRACCRFFSCICRRCWVSACCCCIGVRTVSGSCGCLTCASSCHHCMILLCCCGLFMFLSTSFRDSSLELLVTSFNLWCDACFFVDFHQVGIAVLGLFFLFCWDYKLRHDSSVVTLSMCIITSASASLLHLRYFLFTRM